jgi:hypothetical protein
MLWVIIVIANLSCIVNPTFLKGEVKMKKFEKFCYVFGIVIAIGVGMMFSSVDVMPVGADGSAGHLCDLTDFSSLPCEAVGTKVCVKAHRQVATGTNPKPWNYFKTTDSQCVTNDASCYEKAFDITSDCDAVNE